mgnify:CR=1 FL=1
MQTLDKAFEKLHERYCKILENYYPAHGSTGFTERNLTSNFVFAIESILGDNSIFWLEAPIDIEKRKHIDAVVFDLKSQSSFLIESKRFSNPEQKILEANNDISRLKNRKHYELLEKKLKTKINERYAVLLADVWRENEKKREIYDQWPTSVYQKQDVVWSNKSEFNSLKNYSLLILAVKLPTVNTLSEIT